jgi:hypothetical protein
LQPPCRHATLGAEQRLGLLDERISMPDLRTLSRGMQIAGASAVLLLIVSFFNWWSVDVGPFDVGENAWHGFWGVVMGLLTLVFIGWLVARLMAVDLPELPVPWRTIALVLAALILVFAVIKNIDDPESTIWSYLGVLFAAGIAAGAWLMSQEPEPARSVPDAPEYTPPPATTTAPPPDTPPPPPASTAPQPPAAGTAPPPSTPQAPPTPASTPPPPPPDENP